MFKRLAIVSAVVLTLSAFAANPAATNTENPANPVVTVELVHDQYIKLKDIPEKVIYQASTTVGDDVEVKLEENPSAKEFWQVVSYDTGKCRIKIDHETDGFWPFRKEYAEIEMKGLVRGEQDVVLKCGKKSITIRLKTI